MNEIIFVVEEAPEGGMSARSLGEAIHSGVELAKALSKIGYRITRQTGSHIRLTLDASPQHHVTIPAHDPLKLGTL